MSEAVQRMSHVRALCLVKNVVSHKQIDLSSCEQGH